MTPLDAFLGRTIEEPIVVNVKIKDKRERVFIYFGKIVVPKVKRVDVSSIEIEHECRIVDRGRLYLVVPNVVREIICREGVLCSFSDEHVSKLKKWFLKHAGEVIRKLIY